jgi:(1->4)-alpha-D-glucan 1-alpha-D-glucosylmutase
VRGTYRVQLHNGVGFDEAAGLAGYLRDLGVSHLYCSPVLQAAPGSTHGYDIVDPERLDASLGGDAAFVRLIDALRAEGLGAVIDIVPNHMGVADRENRWWWDVLAHGPGSAYARFFDIEWRSRDAKRAGTVIAPILGERYGEAVDRGAIAILPDGDGFVVTYEDHVLPVAPGTIDGAVPAGPEGIDELLQRQFYRLVYWTVSAEELDYRRFFNIETLVGVRVEDEVVFEETHRKIAELVAGGLVDGLRVDHVDGLRDPAVYLARLRGLAPNAWIGVEKILAADEELPEAWPVDGTTGYDFLNLVNGLLVDAGQGDALTACYRDFTAGGPDYADIVTESKNHVMREELGPEVERLCDLLAVETESRRLYRDYTRREIRAAIRAVITGFGVYRIYPLAGLPLDDAGAARVRSAVARAEATKAVQTPLCRLVGELLITHPEGDFAHRFQQVNSAVMAKGVEDTAFYRYHRLTSLNEVGGDPDRFGVSVDEFHAAMARRALLWPDGMLTLSTHDTKRSADVRARLDVLSEIPGEWRRAVTEWAAHNLHHAWAGLDDRETEYLLYQTIVGAWPLEVERARAYLTKATKEAKLRTDWSEPNTAYDEARDAFVAAVLGDGDFAAIVGSWLVQAGVIEAGRVNSLAQTTLLLTCPGVPDLYQGTEGWDLSLVDPDNRRPVDFGAKRRFLAGLIPKTAEEVRRDHSEDGGVKTWLIQRLLAHRTGHPDAYREPYQPILAEGPQRDHVVAFTRGSDLAVVVPRLNLKRGPWDGQTSVDLPGQWVDVLTGRARSGRSDVGELLEAFPVAVLSRP